MLVQRLTAQKRDGAELSAGEWSALSDEYMRDGIPAAELSALLAAIEVCGLTDDETFHLTVALLASGETLGKLPAAHPRVDRYSAGGVGDKLSLILAPLISSLGVEVPMLQERGNGHAAASLDKLQSIPGMQTHAAADVRAQLGRIGCVMMEVPAGIAPARAMLQPAAHSPPVERSVALTVAAALSRKLALGLSGLVLDVKYGSGAPYPDERRNAELARLMTVTAERYRCRVATLHTSMEAPPGRAIGHALEVEEAVLVLRDDPGTPPDLLELTLAVGAGMLVVSGQAGDAHEARLRLSDAIHDGRAAEQFARIIEAQGGNPAVVEDPALLPQADECEVYRAPRKGHVIAVDPRVLGRALTEISSAAAGNAVDPAAGFVVTVKPGDWVDAGEAIASVFARDKRGIEAGCAALERAIRIERERGAVRTPLILSTPPQAAKAV